MFKYKSEGVGLQERNEAVLIITNIGCYRNRTL